jgi:ABC-type transporter Mla subunit MlaD
MSERMQSLLSRAVEDQLSEQRQLAGALTDVRTQLTRLGTQLEAMQAAPSGRSEQVEQGLAALATDVREAVRLLAERLDGVAHLVQQRGHDLVEVKSSIAELRSTVEAHTGALGGMTSGLAALPAFGERIDTLQSGLGGLYERLRGIEELSAAAAALQQRAEAHDAGLRELRQAFTGVASRAAQLPGRDDIEAMISRVGESVDTLGNRLGRVETSVPSVLERLEEIAELVSGHADGLAAMHERAAGGGPTTADDGGAAAERAVAVESALAAIRERLDELHERPTGADDGEEVTGRLDELHAGLFGPDGVHAQLRALAEPAGSPDESVHDIVAQAVEDSERRLTAHIDEAVLALAEALLRRRSSRATARADLWAATTATVTALTDGGEADFADDEEDEDEELDDELDVAEDEAVGAAEEDEGEQEEDDDGEDAQPAAKAPPGGGPARWQTPVGSSPAAPPEPPAPPAAPKRKPWWRPGD